jgi:hypothetical protein
VTHPSTTNLIYFGLLRSPDPQARSQERGHTHQRRCKAGVLFHHSCLPFSPYPRPLCSSILLSRSRPIRDFLSRYRRVSLSVSCLCLTPSFRPLRQTVTSSPASRLMHFHQCRQVPAPAFPFRPSPRALRGFANAIVSLLAPVKRNPAWMYSRSPSAARLWAALANGGAPAAPAERSTQVKVSGSKANRSLSISAVPREHHGKKAIHTPPMQSGRLWIPSLPRCARGSARVGALEGVVRSLLSTQAGTVTRVLPSAQADSHNLHAHLPLRLSTASSDTSCCFVRWGQQPT